MSNEGFIKKKIKNRQFSGSLKITLLKLNANVASTCVVAAKLILLRFAYIRFVLEMRIKSDVYVTLEAKNNS